MQGYADAHVFRKYKQAVPGNVNDYSLEGLEGRELRNMTVELWGRAYWPNSY